MTLDQLKILIAVAEGGSLGAASKSLHKTQPTLSVGLKNLEQELGVSLFDRSGYRMRLTAAGEQILLSAKKAVAEVDQIAAQAAGYSLGRESRICLGLDYLCPLPVLLSLLRQFSKNCKGTRIDLKFGVLGETESWLQNSEVDLAITPFLAARKDYEMSRMCDLEVLPVVSSDLVLDQQLSEASFFAIPQIVVKTAERPGVSAPFSGLEDSPKWWVSDHMAKRQLILSGFGWGHLELSSVAVELEAKQLQVLENKYVKVSSIPLFLARRKKNDKGEGLVLAELWRYMSEEFEYQN